MIKRTLAVTFFTALLSGVAHAASPTFPSAAEEGSGLSINAPLPASTAGQNIAESVFPSASTEGSEQLVQSTGYTRMHSLERSYARSAVDTFPETAME